MYFTANKSTMLCIRVTMIKNTSFYDRVFTCLHNSSPFSNPLEVTIRQILLYNKNIQFNAIFSMPFYCFWSFHVRWSAKWGCFIWPSPKFAKFCKGTDLRLLSSTKLEFLKSDLYFRNYEHLKFWCFSRGLDQKILGVLLL